MGDERSRKVSILSWLSDERCLKCCRQKLTSDKSDEFLKKMARIECRRKSRKKCMEHDYFNFSIRVDWSKIVELAKMRVQAMAVCSYIQDKIYNFEMSYPGYKVPNWIKHQSMRNSITIQLPVNQRFLGFAISAVHSARYTDYEYKLQFKNALHSVISFDWMKSTSHNAGPMVDSHVILIYYSFPDYKYERLVNELGGVGEYYEVSCEFRGRYRVNKPVIKCGMVPLYVGIPKNEGLERILEKHEIFIDGYRVKNFKQSILKEANIKIPQVDLSSSTPPRDTFYCIWGDEAQTNVGRLRQGEAQIKEFKKDCLIAGTEQIDEFLQRISSSPTSRFYIKNGLLDWCRYSMKRLPIYIQPIDLVHLNLCFSEVEQLWEGKPDLKNLKILDLSHSSIVKLPDLSLATNLENLYISGCMSLARIPFSMNNLNKLQRLDLRACTSLTSIPSSISWKSLQRLDLGYCSTLKCFPKIECLDALEVLNMHDCDNLKSLPSPISLKSLKILDLSNCSKLECFPKIECLDALELLNMNDCRSLKSLPCSIWKLNSLSKFYLSRSSLENLLEIEYSLSSVFQLEKLVIDKSSTGVWHHDDYFDFSNCLEVDELIGSQILLLTKMRTKVVAVHCHFQNVEYRSKIVYPRCEIPEWIKHQNEGNSITIRLPVDKKFIGFALSVVFPAGRVCFDFKLHFRNSSGDCSFESYWVDGEDCLFKSGHVFIMTCIPKGRNSIYNEIVEKLGCIGENYDATLVVSCHDGWNETYITEQDVMKCGIVPLYARKKKELEKRPDESNMVIVRRKKDDMLEAFVDGCRVECPNQEVIIQTCEEVGIETSEVEELYVEPPMPYKHLGTMYCVWGDDETFG